MSEELRSFLLMIKAIAIYLALGALVAAIFYHIKRRTCSPVISEALWSG